MNWRTWVKHVRCVPMRILHGGCVCECECECSKACYCQGEGGGKRVSFD